MCDTFVARSRSLGDPKLEELKASHEEHLKIAEKLRNLMKADLKKAEEDPAVETLTFDLQKTHPIPKVPTNIVFY